MRAAYHADNKVFKTYINKLSINKVQQNNNKSISNKDQILVRQRRKDGYNK